MIQRKIGLMSRIMENANRLEDEKVLGTSDMVSKIDEKRDEQTAER